MVKTPAAYTAPKQQAHTDSREEVFRSFTLVKVEILQYNTNTLLQVKVLHSK